MAHDDLLIRRAQLSGYDGPQDVTVQDGVIRSISAHDTAAPATTGPVLDAGDGLLSPAFVEVHVHPDKSYSLGTIEDRPGEDSFARSTRIKAGFTVSSVAERAERALRLALTNGVTSVRATADVDTVVGLVGLHGLLRAREAMAGLLDVQVVAFPQEGLQRDPGARALLVEAMRQGADVIGGWPNVEATMDEQRAHVRTVFDIAEQFGADVDIHADCWIDPTELMLEVVAEETVRRGYQGRVLASHCCGIEVYPDADAARVVQAVADAQVTIAVIPLNLLDGGPRGLARPHELIAAGARVVVGSDNMNDGWYPLGNLNPLDRAWGMLWGGGFDEDADVDLVWDMITTESARALGAPGDGLVVGAVADLTLLGASSRLDALSHLNGSITTIKAGRVVAERRVETTTADGVLT